MAKKQTEVVKHEEDTLRTLLMKRELLYQQIKENGGEIPATFDKNAEAISQKIDDYAIVNELFQREINNIENEMAPFQKVVDIGKQKIKNLKSQLEAFKAYTCDLVESAGEPGGKDGKKRLIGHNFWIKSLRRESKVFKEGVEIPDEYMVAVVRIPYDDYKEFYAHLKISALEYSDDIPDEYFDKIPVRNVQFFGNTQQELKSNG